MLRVVALWWRQPDHYDQLRSLLHARHLAGFTRATISMIGASLAGVSLLTIWSPTGPHGAVQLSCAVAAAVGAVLGGLFWALRWPTRGQAIAYTVLSNASIALAALAQSEPLGAMLACTTFATMAGYIAVFHHAPLMVYNLAIAALTGAFEATRVTAQFGVAAALSGYSVVLALNLAVPFGVQVVARLLGVDAMRAERDQLTGLLNRRAFHRRARRRLEQGHEQSAHLVVTVIDLDRFKQLNDRYGHPTGDEALVAVAGALREYTDDAAVIGRVGGEEFVVADLCHPDEIVRRAQRLCDAIAALRFNITASLGTASADVSRSVPAALDTRAALNDLIKAADSAMYVAKRRGGNQTCHQDTDYRNDGLSA